MFDVKPLNKHKLVKHVLFCQQKDEKEIVLIHKNGLRLEFVPEVKNHNQEWIPSRFVNQNAWRQKDEWRRF